MTAVDIRQRFISFFTERDHRAVPSASLVPGDDPTLMFTNAGMNQFKDVFLGTGRRDYNRAADSQKCIRVSGKHNDLEIVGRNHTHHTFFEMLGNWSFGDYFKAEAIEWAFELLTDGFGIPAEQLWTTVFAGDRGLNVDADTEAETLWPEKTSLTPDRVLRCGMKDNFWEMGEVGPCGPCSEIHIDLGPKRCDGSPHAGAQCAVNVDGCRRFIELWNLVFIQYSRDEQSKLTDLPARHIDTGMGFERLAAVLQDKTSNYDTDLFAPILAHIAELTGKTYTGRLGEDKDNAFRVIADHVRALTFAITDGVMPSNEGRGYVMRRLLRRAARFGRQHLGQREPFIHRLVPTIVAEMGDAFPELTKAPDRVADVIQDEEATFARTLDRGLTLFNEAAKSATGSGKGRISDGDAFKLYDTYGFPIDLTVQMAEERNLTVDTAGFESLMTQARQRAREAAKGAKTEQCTVDGVLPACDDAPKYAVLQHTSRLVGWVEDKTLRTAGSMPAGKIVGVVTESSCFYAEQGGQIGDRGTIRTDAGVFTVSDTRNVAGGVLHLGELNHGTLEAGQSVTLEVDPARDHTRRNHTATHLLHWALHTVLGDHAEQKGSLVDPEKLRFDFSHPKPVTPDERTEIERLVNERIVADLVVDTRELPTDEAQKLPGVRHLFGEKYGDRVRVVTLGDGFSREFCGGTHLGRTGEAGLFKITSEEGVAKGVRRITAVTGTGALTHVQSLERALHAAAAALKTSPEQVTDKITTLLNQLKEQSKQRRQVQTADVKTIRQALLDSADRSAGPAVIVAECPDLPAEAIRESIDWLRREAGTVAILLAAPADGKVLLVAGVTDDLVAKGVHAGKLIQEVAPIVGGRGGGKPQMAQGSGNNPGALADALASARSWIGEKLAGSR
jgi:alanyl-tRNA synthetase